MWMKLDKIIRKIYYWLSSLFSKRISATDLYRLLLNFSGVSEQTICDSNRRCNGNKCINNSKSKVLEFDGIKRKYAKIHGIIQPSSVDAMTVHNDRLIFVEFKSWLSFFEKFHYQHKGLPTTKDVKDQLQRFDFAKKLTDSIQLCKRIAKNANIDNVSYDFVVITDIETDGIKAIQMRLNLLALMSSPNVFDQCNTLTREKVLNVKVGKKNRTLYKTCREFDSYLKGI